jgi:hypothetical protein
MSSKRWRMPILPMICLSLLLGCGSSGGSGSSSSFNGNFLDQAMTSSEIDVLSTGDHAYAMVERENGIEYVPITLENRFTVGSEDYLTFKDPEHNFGAGDSGSPILNPEGKTIGALSGTFGGDSIAITPITSMLAAVGQSPAPSVAGVSSIQNRLVWFASGVNAAGRDLLRNAGIPVVDYAVQPAPQMTAAKAAVSSPTYTVEAGHSIAVLPFSGPLVNIFAIGTATHRIDADNLVAFGHSMNWDGEPAYAMPVTSARVVQFVNDPVSGSFKLAVPTGAIAGGIVQDRSSAILISSTANVRPVSLIVNAGGTTTTHQLYRSSMDPNLFTTGLFSIVCDQLDNGSPGTFQTTMTVTYDDDTTNTYDMGQYYWSGYDYSLWSAISSDFSRITAVEITLTP